MSSLVSREAAGRWRTDRPTLPVAASTAYHRHIDVAKFETQAGARRWLRRGASAFTRSWTEGRGHVPESTSESRLFLRKCYALARAVWGPLPKRRRGARHLHWFGTWGRVRSVARNLSVWQLAAKREKRKLTSRS